MSHSKFGPKSKKYFIGYNNILNGYRVWDPTTQKIIISRDIVLDESSPIKSIKGNEVKKEHVPEHQEIKLDR